MKKLCLFLALLLAVSLLAACGEPAGEQDGTTPPAVDTTPTETEPTWMTLPADRALTAQQYFVYSCETGEFLTIAQDKAEKIYPASVTKLFTAYIALQYLPSTAEITAGNVLDSVVPGSSVAEIAKGDTLTAEKLVEAMLLPSGNDAAYILAEAAGRVMLNKKDAGTGAAVTRFVEEMNSQARLLGMTGTNFANPDGIHSDSHYTTYADLAIMGTLALEDPVIRKYALVSTETVTLASGEKSWKNTNALINPQSEYYCPYATGLKTGQTPRAGSCLLSSFEYHGHTLLIGVFGCPEADDRFPDTLQLFNKTAADLP